MCWVGVECHEVKTLNNLKIHRVKLDAYCGEKIMNHLIFGSQFSASENDGYCYIQFDLYHFKFS